MKRVQTYVIKKKNCSMKNKQNNWVTAEELVKLKKIVYTFLSVDGLCFQLILKTRIEKKPENPLSVCILKKKTPSLIRTAYYLCI